ncbi:uncharacterized protein LOC130644719 [Hydractinia symbiolongicarpus]|uniref:uncharacterized protein LOC130644719 n=1 Tax=Hydractinia symbiolongicarpus TaxID=13093 RepID=UPI00254DC69D|nr:uncharacterized protein LOC130644719 [Hydractinia symbiolongicarpus]
MTTKALDTLPERLAVEIIHGINLVTEPYFNSVLQLDKIVNDNLDYFNTMESNRTHILTLIPNATTLIENIQTNLTKLYEDMCVDKSVSYCQVLNVKNMKITENFTQIVDLSNTTSRLSGLYEDQLEKKVNQSRMKIATISDVIVKSRNDTASSVKNMTKEIKEFKEKMLNSVDATKDMVS